jgi:exonuclease III
MSRKKKSKKNFHQKNFNRKKNFFLAEPLHGESLALPSLELPGNGIIRISDLDPSAKRGETIRAVRETLASNDLSWAVGGVKWAKSPNGRGNGCHIFVMMLAEAKRAMSALKHLVETTFRCHVAWSKPFPLRAETPLFQQTHPQKVRMASWNINGISSKKVELQMDVQKLRLSILALQETRVNEKMWNVTLPGFQCYCSPENRQIPGARGVALAISKRLSSYLLMTQPHWVMVRVLGIEGDKPWNVLNIYLPHDPATKKRVVREIRAAVAKLLDRDDQSRIIVLGDLNASHSTVDKKLFPPTTGLRRVPIMGSDKTYCRNQRWTAIDHILVSEATVPLVRSPKVQRYFDLSDHFPLTLKVRSEGSLQQLTETPSEPRRKLDVKVMKKKAQGICTDPMWDQWLSTSHTDPSTDPDAESMERTAERWDLTSWSVAEKYGVVTNPTRRRAVRVNAKVRRAVKLKRRAWKSWLDADEDQKPQRRTEYVERRSSCSATVADFRSLEWARYVASGVMHFREGDTRAFFRWVQRTTRYKSVERSQIHPICDDNGELRIEPSTINSLWADHYGKLATAPPNVEEEHFSNLASHLPDEGELEGINDDLSWPEVQGYLGGLKRGKAPGRDGLPAEWLQLLRDARNENGDYPQEPTNAMQKCFFRTLRSMWTLSKIPDRWSEAVLISFPKKGDLTRRDNYRGISLIPVIVKLLTRIITGRIASSLEKQHRVAAEQAGFRIKEECMGQVITILETATRRAQALKEQTILLFIDFRKAYDKVAHDALFAKLLRKGVTGRSLEFLRALYAKSTFRVVSGSLRTGVIRLERGLRQGCPGSPTEFNIFINDLAERLRGVGVAVPGVNTERLASLLFADDLVVLLENTEKLDDAITIIEKWSTDWMMEVGTSKSGIMTVGEANPVGALPQNLNLDGRTFEGEPIPVVEEYTYLGVLLSTSGFPKVKRHTEHRVLRFAERRQRLTAFLSSKSIPLHARKHVFNTVAVPVLRWGSEAVGLAESDIAPMSKVYNETVRLLVGSHSRNTIFSDLTLRRELDLKSFYQLVVQSRLRIYFKSPYLTTWISKFAYINKQPGRGKDAWFRNTHRWLATYPKVTDTDSMAQAIEKVEVYLRNREEQQKGNAQAFTEYERRGYEKTRSYLKHAMRYPEWARGVNWLTRARLSAIWSARRAAQAGLIKGEVRDKCPACGVQIPQEETELRHILAHCQVYAEERSAHLGVFRTNLPDVLSEGKLIHFILGGNDAEEGYAIDPGHAWSGENGETFADSGLPGFVWVAQFLQAIMPGHMKMLWAHQISL